MAWLSVKDFALLKGVSERAVRFGIAAGKYETREVEHPKRKDQVAFLIWNAEAAECGNAEATECGNAEATECGNAEAAECGNAEAGSDPDIKESITTELSPELISPDRDLQEQDGDAIGERSSHEAFNLESAGSNPAGVTNLSIVSNNSEATFKESLKVQAAEAQDVATCKQSLQVQPDHYADAGKLVPASGEIVNLPDLRPRVKEVPLKYKEMVDARLAVIQSAQASGDYALWLQSYQNGLHCVTQASVIGKLSLRTLYRWISDYKRDGVMGLCPGYSMESCRSSKVPEDVQNKLLKILLAPNQVMIGTAIKVVKDHYRLQRKDINCSERTMLRWVENWKREHIGEWTLAREGMKAYREKINRTVLRDWTITNVGDAWVSDGHTIEVLLIDPRDGKAKKYEIVAWLDAASRMPVGASINLTENTEAIQISFRNACLFTGYKPLIVYVDNGKAYKSKYFSGSKRTAEEIELELDGVFGRLGIEVINSQPYNAKAKIIERWWKSLQDQVERMTSGWTGSNAMAKPANLSRDEKYIKGKFAHEALTVEQFKGIFEYWALNIYGQQPHPDCPEKTRMQVFEEGSAQIPVDRRISPEDLNYMLLVIGKKKVGNQGITLNKAIYWNDSLVHYVSRELIVRWDFWDVRSILVYDERDRFVCQAGLRRLQDPLVKLRGEDSVAKRELEGELKQIRNLEKRNRQSTSEILKRVSDSTQDMYDQLPEGALTGLLNQTPLIPELSKEKSLDDRLLEMAAAAPEDADPEAKETAEEQPINPGLNNLAEVLGIQKRSRT